MVPWCVWWNACLLCTCVDDEEEEDDKEKEENKEENKEEEEEETYCPCTVDGCTSTWWLSTHRYDHSTSVIPHQSIHMCCTHQGWCYT